jgi:hypothetical protein
MMEKVLPRLMRAVAKAIDRKDYKSLQAAQELLDSAGKSDGLEGVAISSSRVAHDFSLDEISTMLANSPSRESGFAILEQNKLTRKDLVQIARQNSIYTTKEDRIAAIQNKIIEALVGGRLSSSAIRGEPSPPLHPQLDPKPPAV